MYINSPNVFTVKEISLKNKLLLFKGSSDFPVCKNSKKSPQASLYFCSNKPLSFAKAASLRNRSNTCQIFKLTEMLNHDLKSGKI